MGNIFQTPPTFQGQVSIQLWATPQAEELMRREGEGQRRALLHWAQRITKSDSSAHESYTVPCPGELFFLHVRPQGGAALFYTASFARALGNKSDLARLSSPLFRRLLMRCHELEGP